MVGHLRVIDEALAEGVAQGLGFAEMPQAVEPARPVVPGLAASDALSILRNGPSDFSGRKIGVLIADGFDAALLAALRNAAEAEGAIVEIVAPRIGGAVDAEGSLHPARQKLDGGPSVLYDAVAVLVGEKGAAMLAAEPATRDFLADAYAHAKFIGLTHHASDLLTRAGAEADEGCVLLDQAGAADAFVTLCRGLRCWPREEAALAARGMPIPA